MSDLRQEKTVLLVDDEAGIRKVLGISLTDIGYRVYTAENGVRALRLFREKRPAIVITDIKMPGMDGIELLGRIKEESPDTEVIMITGHGDMDLAVKSLKYEATDFITKPVHSEDLETALDRAWKRISLNHRIKSYMDDLETLVSEKSRKICEAENLVMVGRTIAGMSHAIKNIAGGLKGGSFVLEQGIKQENREYLVQGWEMMKGNIDKIMNLALSILNYAKSSGSEPRLEDPLVPAKEVYDLMRGKVEGCGIRFVLDHEETFDPVRFSRDDIHDCLLNLVSNACDACLEQKERDGHEIRLVVAREEGWGVVYRVTDNSIGMNETVRQSIFREFFTTKGSGGTGFGLMTTKKNVDEHGGVIEFTTEEGFGSEFVIKLP